MALEVPKGGCLVEHSQRPQVGDVLEHGTVMRVEVISVSDFIMFALSGGIPLQGFDEVLVDERFVVSASSEDGEDAFVDSNDEDGVESGINENYKAGVTIGSDEEHKNSAEAVDDEIPSIIGGDVLLIWVNHLQQVIR